MEKSVISLTANDDELRKELTEARSHTIRWKSDIESIPDPEVGVVFDNSSLKKAETDIEDMADRVADLVADSVADAMSDIKVGEIDLGLQGENAAKLEELREHFRGLGRDAESGFSRMGKQIAEVDDDVAGFSSNTVGNLGRVAKAALGVTAALGAIGAIAGLVVGLSKAIKDTVTESEAFQESWSAMQDAIKGIIKPLTDDLVSALTVAVDYIAFFANIAAEVFPSVYGTIKEFVTNTVASVAGTLYEGFLAAYTGIQVVVGNIGDIVEAGAARVALSQIKSAEDTKYTFTEVIPAYLKWFSENWWDILGTVAHNTEAAFKNLGENAARLWEAVKGAMMGKGFEFDFKPLTDGFINTVKPLPEIAAREMTAVEKVLSEKVAKASGGLADKYAEQLESNRKALSELASDFALPTKISGTLPQLPEAPESAGGNEATADGNIEKNKKAKVEQEESFKSTTMDLESFGRQIFGESKRDKAADSVDAQTETLKGQHRELVSAITGEGGNMQDIKETPSGLASPEVLAKLDGLKTSIDLIRESVLSVSLSR